MRPANIQEVKDTTSSNLACLMMPLSPYNGTPTTERLFLEMLIVMT